MKRIHTAAAAFGFAAMLFAATACSDRNNGSDSDQSNAMKDSSVTDSRRFSTDTVNYLTKDSSKSSQQVVDPNPPDKISH